MDDDIINKLESLKSSIEESARSARRCDTFLKIFLTSEEIEELSNLRAKQEENFHRMVDIINFTIHRNYDKVVVTDPDIEMKRLDMIALEMTASTIIASQTEDDIIKIYEKVKLRLFDI